MTESSGARRFLVRSGDFFFRSRDGLAPLVFLSLIILTRPRYPGGSVRLDMLLDGAGLLLAVVGQIIRIGAVGYQYIIRGGRKRRVYAEDLVTGGLFATCRNPLYLGNLLIYLGLFVIWNSPGMYVAGGFFFLFMYRAIIATEEAFLERKFGEDYLRYCNEVGRWLPNPRRLREGIEGMSLNWPRVVVKEYGSFTAWTLTALLLIALEGVHLGPPTSLRLRIVTSSALSVGIVALWGLARWLKLTRRLRA